MSWTQEQMTARYFWQVLPENMDSQVIHHHLYPDHKSLLSKNYALDYASVCLAVTHTVPF